MLGGTSCLAHVLDDIQQLHDVLPEFELKHLEHY